MTVEQYGDPTDLRPPRLPDGFQLVQLDTTGSTNDEAKALATAGAPEGTVVWAREQTAGRGRQGRSWSSPPGNLHMSLVLRPKVPAAEAALLGFVASLAVADTIDSYLYKGPGARLKWPNDVLLDGAKVAGLLLEAEIVPAVEAPPAQIGWVVLGIGINLAHSPPDTPYKSGAMAAFGAIPTPGHALARLALALRTRIEAWQRGGFGPVRDAWLARAHGINTAIAVREGDRVTEGIFLDLDADGALRLETLRGVFTVRAGDVFFPRG